MQLQTQVQTNLTAPHVGFAFEAKPCAEDMSVMQLRTESVQPATTTTTTTTTTATPNPALRQAAFSTSGLVAWYNNDDLVAPGFYWPNRVDNSNASRGEGIVGVETYAGFGATKNVTYLYGGQANPNPGLTTFATYNFGNVLKTQFSVCSVTRWTTDDVRWKGRILTSRLGTFIHGHWQNKVGVAKYETWETPFTYNQDTAWVVVCGTNVAPLVFVNGKSVGIWASRAGGDQAITINTVAREESLWAVAELIVWNRGLREDEMRMTYAYLKNKFGLFGYRYA